jgi:phosphoribosylaminoimidazole carboxylase (NCAIR synthetase)
MKGSYVVLQIRLDSIRNFLEHKIEAETEIQAVLARNESGEFHELDEFDNALHHPIMRQEIAAGRLLRA